MTLAKGKNRKLKSGKSEKISRKQDQHKSLFIEQRKKSAVLLLILVIICLAFYIFVDSQAKLIPILFAVLFLTISGLYVSFAVRGLDIELSGSSQVGKGEKMLTVISVYNPAVLPAIDVECVVNVTNLTNLNTREIRVRGGVMGRRRREFEIGTVSKYAGAVRFEVKSVRIMGLFGMLIRKIDVEAIRISYVMPVSGGRNLGSDVMAGYDAESFKYSQFRKGDDPTEIFGIREYVPGDSAKAIHWKLSAKSGEMMIREFGFPIDSNIIILLDKSPLEINESKIDNDLDELVSISDELRRMDIAHDIGYYDHARREFRIHSINQNHEIFEYVPQILRAETRTDAVGTIDAFVMADVSRDYSLYLLIGSNFTGVERLAEYGSVERISAE